MRGWVAVAAVMASAGVAMGQGLPTSRMAVQAGAGPESAEYRAVQAQLTQGWNTWDVHSVTTEVLLPDGLAIHVGLQHNATEGGDGYLGDALIGRQSPGAEVVFPGPHSWDGSYTDLKLTWRGHALRLQTAHVGRELVMLATPLAVEKRNSVLPGTLVVSADYLWDRPGTVVKSGHTLVARGPGRAVTVYCTCTEKSEDMNLPVGGAFLSVDFTGPVGLSTGAARSVEAIEGIVEKAAADYKASAAKGGATADVSDAIETVLGWDTIYEPEERRVVSPVSRVWSEGWGGYVIFDWDTFFAATMASIGDKDLAQADALETLREETAQGFVPNYARAGGWKSSDRSEPPVGAITVLGIYKKYPEKWFVRDAFEPLLRWNRWWAEHRDYEGYLTWGSDGKNAPENLDDGSRGTRGGAILESGLDNSPMYDGTTYNAQTHTLEYGDVGLMSMYVADCDALATMADVLGKTAEANEVRARAEKYRAKLGTMWDAQAGIFLNIDLHTGKKVTRLSPTNFYPLLAKAATPAQAQEMVQKHLLNDKEFWGTYVIPSIERNDPAYKDQDYWRGRIWGPMNYLVYLGLRNYDLPQVQREFAQKSYDLFLKEWKKNGHVHENYNGTTGEGDDVHSSDRFYHWGALLGYVQYLQVLRARR